MSHCDACNKEGDFSFSIQVHSFPRDAQMRKQWIHAVQGVIEGWTPKEDSVLCSKHFEESCYKDPDPVLGKAGKMCRGLKDTAVPTVFKAAKKADLVQNHRENGKLSSAEMDRHLAEEGQENACSRDKSVTTNNKGKEEGVQPKLSSSNCQHLSNGEMAIDAVTVSADGLSVTFDAEGCHDEQKEFQEWTPASKQESNPAVFFDGDLNLPLRKVFEQMAKIKEERAKRAAVDQSKRDIEDAWWCTVAQDFRSNLETYTQQFETSQSHIPVTFDPSVPRMLSVLGDSQETFRLKEELTVPCLGKLYSGIRTLCPHCGSILSDMTKVVNHMCKAKRKALESGRFGFVPDVTFVKEKKWKRFPKSARKTKKSEVTGGLVDVFDTQGTCRLPGESSTHNANKTKTKIKKGKRIVNMWKKLKLQQMSKISRKKSPIMKKKEKKKKKKKKKNRCESKGQFRALKMQVQARSELKSFIEQSLDERMKERQMERASAFSGLTNEAATDLLFADLEMRGFVRTEKGPVDLGYPLQSDIGHSKEQSIADMVNAPQVYPVGIIPSSLLLTNLNTAPCPENNVSMDLDDKSLLQAQLGPLPEPAFPSPVQYENSSAAEFRRCDLLCSSEKELGRHQSQDTTSALNVSRGVEGDSGGGGGGGGAIRLSDGTVVKAEPMDDDR